MNNLKKWEKEGALVPYDASKANSIIEQRASKDRKEYTTDWIYFYRKEYQSLELRKVRQKIEQLQSGARLSPYIGLGNQGATCYMNSLLQTLFMTPEVRQHIYSYKYNPEIHGSKEYCIPYQLQKLFANLQLSRQSHIGTKDLTKSFHWASSESFQQQDIQEFCRVLFDAIDRSFALKITSSEGQKDIEMTEEPQISMTDLYEGHSHGFVKCLVCGYESKVPDRFQDISLPIRNEMGTGVLNSSVEMALENYIKPEKLEGSNQYMCQDCDKKQDAEKGIKLTRGPPILTIALNRFTLDYQSYDLKRMKLTDRVSFTQLLNFNDYLNGYENIKNKKYQQEVERQTKYNANQVEKAKQMEIQKQEKLANLANKKQEAMEVDQVSQPSQAQEQSAQQSDKAEQADSEMNEQEPITKIDHTKNQNSIPRAAETGVSIGVGLEADAQKPKEEQSSKPSGSNIGAFDEQRYNEYLFSAAGPKQRRIIGAVQDENDLSSFDQDYAAVSGAYSVKGQGEKFSLAGVGGSDYQHSTAREKTPEEIEAEEMARALEQIRQMEEQELLRKDSKTEEQKTMDLLKEGEYVYELYAIMIHSGGAYGGHYYAYIKSFEDGQWYNFNDTTVTPLKEEADIFNTFGGAGQSGTAYLLMYRKVTGEEKKYKFEDSLVPEYLREDIEKDTEKCIKEEKEKEQKLLQLKLKVFHEGRSQDIEIKKDQSLKDLISLCIEKFSIQGKEISDIRLRAYDPMMKTRLGIFDQYDATLMEIDGISVRARLDMEFKDEAGNFEEYNRNWQYLKAVLYQDDMNFDFTQPDSFPSQIVKIDKAETTVSELEQMLSEMFDVPKDELIILLRHERGYNSTVATEYFNMQWRRDKKICDANTKFEHGTVLFCERGKASDDFNNRKWKLEFDQEASRITLSINDPNTDPEGESFNIKVSLPRTSTIRQLKDVIAKRISVPVSQFYLEREANGKRMKELNKSLTYESLSNHSQIKVVLGSDELDGKHTVSISVIMLKDDGKDNEIFSSQAIGKLQVKSEATGLEFKQQILDLYKQSHPDSEMTLDGFRVRNPNHDLGEVVHDNQVMEDIYIVSGLGISQKNNIFFDQQITWLADWKSFQWQQQLLQTCRGQSLPPLSFSPCCLS